MKNIPVISVTGKSLAEAYETALIYLYGKGTRFKTQYDRPGDPLSIDCTMNLTILEPEIDPMIHMAFPGGVDDLREYVLELEGLKDHLVKNMNDPEDKRPEYTYHGRLQNYGVWKELVDGESKEEGAFEVDQIQNVINKLAEQPFTRQAQMITWMPNIDFTCDDPPSLQSLWYRVLEDEDGTWWLNSNIRYRSNDAWNAGFLNMFGFIQFSKDVVAAGIAAKTGKTVKLGRMNWQADSYHIYGKDIRSAKERLFERINDMAFEERTMNFNDQRIRQVYDNAEAEIVKKIKGADDLKTPN
nr:thymidylate synthase [uncultured Draconibacterium sp.]